MKKIIIGITSLVIILALWIAAAKLEYKINDYKIEKIITQKSAYRLCFASSYSTRMKENRVIITLDEQERDISHFRGYEMGSDGEYIALVIDRNNTIQDVFSVIHTTAKKYMPDNKNCMDLQ